MYNKLYICEIIIDLTRMKKNFLFPNQYKSLGWILFVPSFIFGIIYRFYPLDIDDLFTFHVFSVVNDGMFSTNKYFGFVNNCVIDEILLTLIIVGGVLVAFSKTKIEDEFIAKIRYESLVWATYFNLAVILFATIFIYDQAYLDVMTANIFSMLLFFIIRFHFKLQQLQTSTCDEE